MKILVLSLLAALMLYAGQGKTAGKQTKPAATKAAKLEVPAGAEQTGPNSWRHTDGDGKTWIYRKTPFGLTRFPEPEPKAKDGVEPGAGPAAEAGAKPGGDSLQRVKAVQVGAEIRFERSSPFGVTRWTKKPDELTDFERSVWERDRPRSGATDSKDTAKEQE